MFIYPGGDQQYINVSEGTAKRLVVPMRFWCEHHSDSDLVAVSRDVSCDTHAENLSADQRIEKLCDVINQIIDEFDILAVCSLDTASFREGRRKMIDRLSVVKQSVKEIQHSNSDQVAVGRKSDAEHQRKLDSLKCWDAERVIIDSLNAIHRRLGVIESKVLGIE